jgi:glycerophosphoryl diester phosphodiesterase
MSWRQPPENTVPALVEGVTRFDGVEFDLRLSADEELVLHHDHHVSIDEEKLLGKQRFVEQWQSDDLKRHGFDDFNSLLENKDFTEQLIEQSKVAFIEIKPPHRSIQQRRENSAHLTKILKQVTELLKLHEIPRHNVVVYSFHSAMAIVAKNAAYKGQWSELRPVVPPVFGSFNQRIRAFPEYFTTSFARLVKNHRNKGSVMMPCAKEYLFGWKRHLPLGKAVGVSGRGLRRLRGITKGYPVHVWPCKGNEEWALLNAGLSVITDDAHPEQPITGAARWQRPASLPLSLKRWQGLAQWQIPDEVSPWCELNESEKIVQVETWRKQHRWQRSADDILADSRGELPWEAVRIIGHRGCGKVDRPVMSKTSE